MIEQTHLDYLPLKANILTYLAMFKTARLYYDHAKSAWDEERGSERALMFADRLESAVTHLPAKRWYMNHSRVDNYAHLLSGRLSRETCDGGEGARIGCFRVYLLEGIRKLGDGDIKDDPGGGIETIIKMLVMVLMHAADSKNAGALLATIFRLSEREKTTSGCDRLQEEVEDVPEDYHKDVNRGHSGQNRMGEFETDCKAGGEDREDSHIDTKTKKEHHRGQHLRGLALVTSTCLVPQDVPTVNIKDQSGGYLCDECERRTFAVNEWYFCEVCDDIHCCGECLAKLQDPNTKLDLYQSLGDPAHNMYRAWPIDSEVNLETGQPSTLMASHI